MNTHIEALRDATGSHVSTLMAAAEAFIVAHGKRLRVAFDAKASHADRQAAIDQAVADAAPKNEKE